MDGLLVLGTTGEGILLSPPERRLVADQFLHAAKGRLAMVIHCGAQSTRDTAALAEHAASNGADGVAVIPPPYFALDAASVLRHLAAAAMACAPTPFYAYEFAARSGYAIPIVVLERLRDTAANFAGLKVSDDRFEVVEPYIMEGLDVFIGAEALIQRGLERGAVGAVSAVAAALPELIVDAVRSRGDAACAKAAAVRTELQQFPFHAALKTVVARRGVEISSAVRAPLRMLDDHERQALEQLIGDPRGDIAPFTARRSPQPGRRPENDRGGGRAGRTSSSVRRE